VAVPWKPKHVPAKAAAFRLWGRCRPQIRSASGPPQEGCYPCYSARERAEKIYQELLEQYPNEIQILNDLAWILQEHYHRYAAALELANRGLRLEPDELHLLDTRGTFLSNLPDKPDLDAFFQ